MVEFTSRWLTPSPLTPSDDSEEEEAFGTSGTPIGVDKRHFESESPARVVMQSMPFLDFTLHNTNIAKKEDREEGNTQKDVGARSARSRSVDREEPETRSDASAERAKSQAVRSWTCPCGASIVIEFPHCPFCCGEVAAVYKLDAVAGVLR